MLSNPLQRFSPYQNLPQSTLMPNGHVPQNSMNHNDLDSLTQHSQYGIHQLHQGIGVSNPQLARSAPNSKQRHQPYSPSGRSSGANGQVRRRISRACDQCNQLRTKCDGQHPCAHCIGKLSAPTRCSSCSDWRQNSGSVASTPGRERNAEKLLVRT